MDIHDVVKEIKLSFRLMMDGAVVQSMRDKGLNYHLNWGATLPRLQAKAEEIRLLVIGSRLMVNDSRFMVNDSSLPTLHSSLYDLSIALYKENVRECKILASMLMPPDEVLPEVIDIWQEQIPTQEIAEQLAFNLYQHLPFAADKAYQWIASDKEYDQLCGFHVLYPAVRKAAMQSLQRFAELGLLYERLAKSATKSIDLDIF